MFRLFTACFVTCLWVSVNAANPASEATKQLHAEVLRSLPFDQTEDFELAGRGLIARPDAQLIKTKDGQVIWDLTQNDDLKGARPDTVNPSLWRQAQLNAKSGLYQVTDRIYQIRGFDLANVTFIQGDTGWIVVDPLTSVETMQAAMAMVEQHLGQRPVRAILSTHSHADHFGGIRALTEEEDLISGAIRYVVPEHFVRESVSENVIAGNAMTRRATYMFGNLLPKSVTGHVDSGLGQGVALGTISLLKPTDTITQSGQKLKLDGVEFEFQLTPDAESPSEFIFYLPQMKALCVAELANAVMHNLYTLRGAKVRDALIWSRHLTHMQTLFGERFEVVFGGHHWPRWGNDAGNEYLSKQRDTYRYLHDQSVRLMNQGLTEIEIAQQIKLPPSLANEFYNRGYYGTVSHNVRAVYNFYLGYFDAVPARLDPLPPVEIAHKYVKLAGGPEALMRSAHKAYDHGEYRWTAELVNHLVFAAPDHEAAKALLADSYEQLGYQAESGPWRDFYLSGAQELRQGIDKSLQLRKTNVDVVAAVPTSLLLDFLGVRFNPEGADELKVRINLHFTDTGEKFVLSLAHSVLNNIPNAEDSEADVSLKLTRSIFNQVAVKQTSFPKEVLKGNVVISGNPAALFQVFSRLESFDPWFNIVTP